MSLENRPAAEVNGYLLLFRNTNWADKGLSRDQISALVEKVNAWFDHLAETGRLRAAQPLFDEGAIITGNLQGERFVTDGPFAEAKEAIGGYVLISADSLEDAIAVAQGNPMLDYGHTTEVRPTATACPHIDRIFARPPEEVPVSA